MNEIKTSVSVTNYIKPMDYALLPVILVGVTKIGKFRFYRLTIYWLRRGVELSIGKGPYTIAQAQLINIMRALREEARQ